MQNAFCLHFSGNSFTPSWSLPIFECILTKSWLNSSDLLVDRFFFFHKRCRSSATTGFTVIVISSRHSGRSGSNWILISGFWEFRADFWVYGFNWSLVTQRSDKKCLFGGYFSELIVVSIFGGERSLQNVLCFLKFCFFGRRGGYEVFLECTGVLNPKIFYVALYRCS